MFALLDVPPAISVLPVLSDVTAKMFALSVLLDVPRAISALPVLWVVTAKMFALPVLSNVTAEMQPQDAWHDDDADNDASDIVENKKMK